MEIKKKRTKCETSDRQTFILNSLNPKEKVIIDFLATQYNKSDSIKDILYEYIMSNNLQVKTQPMISKGVINNNQVIRNLPNDDKYMVSSNTTNDNTVVNKGVQIDNEQQSKDISNDNNFNIDLSSIGDEEVTIDTRKEDDIDATKNAMDYLLKM